MRCGCTCDRERNGSGRLEEWEPRYGSKVALRDITLEITEREIFGIIGPANSGKTTLLKCINRTIDFVPSAKVEGKVRVNGQNVRTGNVYELRRQIGMVFPLPAAPWIT